MTTTSYSDQLQPAPIRRASSVPNQLLFRAFNEQLHLRRVSRESGHGEIEIVCECEHHTCTRRLSLTLDDYDAIRGFPTRFVMVPGHSTADDERIVERRAGFLVVEKTGRSARVAARLDPRRHQSEARPAA